MDTAPKRGDILEKQDAAGRLDYFHVERVHADGSVDAIADDTGLPAGLNVNRDTLRQVSMAEVLAHRARSAYRAPVDDTAVAAS